MKIAVLVFATLCATACVSSPPERWSSRDRIEQTIQEKLPLGSSREAILNFFDAEGVTVMELPPLEKRPEHTLTVSFPTRRRGIVEYTVLVTFYLGKDDRSENVKYTDAQAGTL